MFTVRTLLAALVVPSLLLVSASVPAAPGAPELVAKKTCSYPSQIFSLTNWKLTLPTGPIGTPDEVKQPQLATYRNPPYFFANTNCVGAGFAAPVNGTTTSGSKYPRSELREMTNNGKDNASWSSSLGTHTVTVTEAFDHLPVLKPQLVGLQIHDALDDISTFRLEGSKLYITNGDNAKFYLVTSSYKLGTAFTAKYAVSGNQVKAYYNGKNVVSFPATFEGAYFKAGAYTQSNCDYMDAAGMKETCASSNYGRTLIYALSVTHQVPTTMQRITSSLARLFGFS